MNQERVRLLKFPPALALFLLAPVIGELLSGSSPPAEFFSPVGFVLLVSLYGGGAVVVRELKLRWNKGIGSLLLLGAAYGVLEEGLMVTSFFSPSWPDLGALGVYGRWLGVNWVWAEMLTIYHAVFSTTVPIILVELAYPQQSQQRWVGNKTFKALIILLGAVTVIGTIGFSNFMQHWTSPTHYLFALALLILFGYAAHKLPNNWGQKGQKQLPRPYKLWIFASLASFAFFLGFWSMPSLIPLWPIAMLYGPLLTILTTKFLKRYNWNHPIKHEYLFALASGALTFFLVFAPLQELDKTRPDNTTGMTLVSLAFIIGLLWLHKRIKYNKPA